MKHTLNILHRQLSIEKIRGKKIRGKRGKIRLTFGNYALRMKWRILKMHFVALG